jgi:hypothetical protein
MSGEEEHYGRGELSGGQLQGQYKGQEESDGGAQEGWQSLRAHLDVNQRNEEKKKHCLGQKKTCRRTANKGSQKPCGKRESNAAGTKNRRVEGLCRGLTDKRILGQGEKKLAVEPSPAFRYRAIGDAQHSCWISLVPRRKRETLQRQG